MVDRTVPLVSAGGHAPRVLSAAFALLAMLLVLAIVYDSVHRAPSFDGATNLQAAHSLANGEGYRRTYADREPFSHSIQSKLPYVVPAAVTFRLFGVGIWQAQSANIIFLLLLVASTAILVGRRFGTLAAAAAVIVLCVTPGLLEFGFGGYGEIPGLALALLALVAWPWRTSRHRLARIFVAGGLLGLAFATKVVLAICSGAFGLVFVMHLLSGARGDAVRASWVARTGYIALLALASLFPLLLVEAWKYVAVGGMPGYMAWWQEGFSEIGKQAGTRPGFADTVGVLPKIRHHLDLLQGHLGLSMPALLAWLVLPYALALRPLLRERSWWRWGPLVCLLFAAGIYLAWWLALTPTLKAYHRRILDGTLLLNIAWVYIAGWYLAVPARHAVARAARWLPLLAILAFAVSMYRSDAARSLFHRSAAPTDLLRTVDEVAGLPADAYLFGTGWYSAPAVSLLAGRPLRDFNDTPVVGLDRRRPAYFIFDNPGLANRRQEPIERMYRTRRLLPDLDRYQVYEVHLDQLADAIDEADLPRLRPDVDMTTDEYPFVAGFHRPESNGTRWMMSDAFIVLRYDGSPNVQLDLYTPAPDRYMRRRGVRLTVLLEGCEIASGHPVPRGRSKATLPIPPGCRPAVGDPVTLRLMADDLIRSGIIQDDRALSVVVLRAALSNPSTSPSQETSQ